MAKAMNIQFTDETNQTIERLATRIGTSKAGAIRFGLRLLEIAVRESDNGNAIGVVRGDRVVKEVAGLWAPSAA